MKKTKKKLSLGKETLKQVTGGGLTIPGTMIRCTLGCPIGTLSCQTCYPCTFTCVGLTACSGLATCGCPVP